MAKPRVQPRRIQPDVKKILPHLKFCPKCGWMMGKISYIDISTKKRIRKHVCSNRKCSEYNK